MPLFTVKRDRPYRITFRGTKVSYDVGKTTVRVVMPSGQVGTISFVGNVKERTTTLTFDPSRDLWVGEIAIVSSVSVAEREIDNGFHYIENFKSEHVEGRTLYGKPVSAEIVGTESYCVEHRELLATDVILGE